MFYSVGVHSSLVATVKDTDIVKTWITMDELYRFETKLCLGETCNTVLL